MAASTGGFQVVDETSTSRISTTAFSTALRADLSRVHNRIQPVSSSISNAPSSPPWCYLGEIENSTQTGTRWNRWCLDRGRQLSIWQPPKCVLQGILRPIYRYPRCYSIPKKKKEHVIFVTMALTS
jgi:hypothetical protein